MASRPLTPMRAIAATLAVALIASGCSRTNDSDDGDSAPTLTASCPDLVEVGCNVQVAEKEIPVAGTEMRLHYRSDRVAGRAVAPRWDAAAGVALGGWTLTPHHVFDPKAKTLFAGDGATRSVEAIAGPGGELLVAAVDGGEVYTFSDKGQHLRTDDRMTGALIRRFEYDDKGRLTAIEDCFGERTTIARTAGGLPFEIAGPGGHRTRLFTDSNDYLSTVIDPAGGGASAVYGRGGQLASLTDAGERSERFEYDDDGRLVQRTDAAGVVTEISRTTKGDVETITETRGDAPPVRWTHERLAEGARRHSIDEPGRGRTEETISDRERSIVRPDGTKVEVSLEPDPRWAMQAPLVSVHAATPGGREVRAATTRTSTENRTTVAGATTTRSWDPETDTITSTDTRGRATTTKVDSCANPTAITRPGEAPVAIAYDTRGRPTEVAEGAGRERVSTARFLDQTGEVEVTDPAAQTWRFAADPLGRLAAAVRPDGRRTTLQRSPSGAPISVSIDGDQVRTLGWSPLGRLLTSGPTAAGLDLDTMRFDDLGRPEKLDRPGGKPVAYGWTDDGRLESVGPVTFGYDDETGLLTSASTDDGPAMKRTYDGSVPVRQTTSGPVEAAVAWAYDDAGRTASIDVGGAPQNFGYDAKGDLVRANGLTLARDPETGRVVSTDAGAVHTDVRYDAFGAVVGQSVRSGDQPLFDAAYVRDGLGRVVATSETIQGERHQISYEYDPAGRLTRSTRDGVATAYAYDAHDNRTSAGAVAATYDAADRLMSNGSTSYGWELDGDLRTSTTPAGTTTFERDAQGALRGASLPGGRAVAYLDDHTGRRAATLVDGRITRGYVYGDGTRPLASTGPSGSINERFLYTEPGAPALIERANGTSRVISDPTGSPRLVVDAATGQVQQRIDYDAFGQTIVDSDPGFQPVGFGGGLVDPARPVVNIDGREYDPASGGFTAADPSSLDGSTTVVDPVNGREVTSGGSAGTSAGGGGESSSPSSAAGASSGGGAATGRSDGGEGGGGDGHVGGAHAGGEATLFGGQLTTLGAALGLAGAHTAGRIVSGAGGAFGLYEAWHIYGEIQHGGNNLYNRARMLAAGFGAGVEIAIAAGFVAAPFTAVLVAAALVFAAVALYAAIKGGSSSGDPHLTTHDGRPFELQAVGELVLTRSDDRSFEAQVRQQPVDTAAQVSINTAIAVGVDGDRVTVSADASPPVRIDGKPVDLPAGSIDLPHGGKVVRHPTGELEIRGAKGDRAFVRIVHRRQLAITVSVSDAHRGHVSGLYGNANGNIDDDLASKDGTIVDDEPTDHTGPLYAVFAKSWRVTQAESLFNYEPGTDTSTFTDLNFPASAATVDTLDPARRARARSACKAGGLRAQPFLDNCTLDVALMNDTTMISTAVDAQQSSASTATGPASTSAVAVGETITGRIRAPRGESHHTFDGNAGDVVYISAADDCEDNGLLWIVVGPTGSNVARSATICADLGVIEEDVTGTYTVRVMSRDDSSGRFSFGLRQADSATSAEIAVGDHVTGRIAQVGQRHTYTFAAEAGDVVYLRAGTPCQSPSLSWRFNGPEGSIANVSNDLCLDLRRQELDRDGTYTISVSGRDRSTGDYAFDVLLGEPTETSTLHVGDHIVGTIGRPGGRDRYELRGNAGDVITLKAPRVCTAGKQQWWLLGPSGSALNVSNDVCNDIGRLTLDLDGNYVLSITGHEDEIGEYSFDIGGG